MLSTYMPFIAAALVALAVVMVSMAFVGQTSRRRKLGDIKAKVEAGHGVQQEHQQVRPSHLKGTLARLLTSLGERFKPKDALVASKTRFDLIRAGYRQQRAPVVFYGIKGILLLIPAGIFLVLRVLFFHTIPLQLSFLGVAFLMVLGYYLPKMWLGVKISKRRQEFLFGLPDALDLLVVCVESGMGLDQALFRVGQEMRRDCGIISEELKILNLEQRAGKPRSDALRDLARRVDLEDVSSLVTLLVQSEAFGTSVAKTLRVYSDTLRTKRSQRAEEQAAKLPVKLLIPLIFFIFPALFAVIGGPAVIALLGIFAQTPH